MSTRQLVLGAILSGAGGGGGGSADLWRRPDVPTDASVNIRWNIQQALEAEAALFDFVFIVDSQYVEPTFPPHHLNRFEPLTLLSAIAVRTQRLGLVATVSTTYSEPWDIARRLASLDLISGGRAGWNIVTSYDAGTAGNFGRVRHDDVSRRYARAQEAVDVVRGLWASYDEHAFAVDKQATSFLDPARQHKLDHHGEFFQVAGPLNAQRSRQGEPVLVQAGVSDPGRELNARVGEVAFSFARSIEWAREFRGDVLRRAEAYGRTADDVLFVPALSTRIRHTDEEAVAAEQDAAARFPLRAQLDRLERQFGRPFALQDLDRPFPPLDSPAAMASVQQLFGEAHAEGRTLREVAVAANYHAAHFVGSAETVADEIERWHASGAVDGFNLFVREPDEFARFRRLVVPILQRRGLFRDSYSGSTLREHLGLRVPVPRRVPAAVDESVA